MSPRRAPRSLRRTIRISWFPGVSRIAGRRNSPFRESRAFEASNARDSRNGELRLPAILETPGNHEIRIVRRSERGARRGDIPVEQLKIFCSTLEWRGHERRAARRIHVELRAIHR